MTRALILAAASAFAFATPALAQQPASTAAPAAAAAPADPSCPPEHAAMGHCTPKSAAPAPAPPAADPSCPPEHAAMGHCTPKSAPPPAPPPAASDPSCPPEHAAMGHCTPATPAAAAPSPVAAPRVAPPPQAAFSGPENAADAVWNPQAMAVARRDVYAEHGGFRGRKLLLDRFEYRAQDGGDGYAWDGEAWFGGDYDRLWLKTEGEGAFGDAVEEAEVQALYSRAIDPWFNLQTGVRYDIRPEPDRAHLVLGIQGLAPYWFEVDGALFVSTKGDVTARLEAEYDQRITNQLIVQPRVELDLAAQDVPELGIGAGLSSAEAGLRLRYEIVPEFAPYLGVQYERRFGDTADFARAEGEEAGGWTFLVGLRSWF